MNPRLRRLQSDYEDLRRRFDGDPYVVIQPIGPVPPDRYTVVYRVPSLRRSSANQVVEVSQTVVQVFLGATYPREKPVVTSVDPVFHPNFGMDNAVCIADFWSPAMSLTDILVKIGDMLQMKTYNIQSALNAEAAEWANTHRGSFPLGNAAIGVTDVEVSLGRSLPAN